MAVDLKHLFLAEFTGILMAETYEAILSTWRYQKEQIAEFEAALLMSDETLWATHHNEAGLEMFLETLLGVPYRGLEGEFYTPPSNDQPEIPPFSERMSLQLVSEDYVRKVDGFALSAKGSKKVQTAGKALLCQRFRTTAAQLLSEGVPQIRVQQGRIMTKIYCQMDAYGESNMVKTRLRVSPASLTQAYSLNKRLNLSSELEIQFTIE